MQTSAPRHLHQLHLSHSHHCHGFYILTDPTLCPAGPFNITGMSSNDTGETKDQSESDKEIQCQILGRGKEKKFMGFSILSDVTTV